MRYIISLLIFLFITGMTRVNAQKIATNSGSVSSTPANNHIKCYAGKVQPLKCSIQVIRGVDDKLIHVIIKNPENTFTLFFDEIHKLKLSVNENVGEVVTYIEGPKNGYSCYFTQTSNFCITSYTIPPD